MNARTYLSGALVAVLAAAAMAQAPMGPRRINPLADGLVAAWTLDESSGTRVDCVGTNDLTAINAPAAVEGKLGLAGGFRSAASQRYTAAESPSLNVSNASFTLAAWIFISNSPASYLGVLGARSSASPFTNDQFAIDFVGGAGLRHTYTIGASANNTITNTSTITNSWMLIFAYCDVPGALIGAELWTTNGVENRTTSRTINCGRGCTFEIGCARASSFFSGAIDDVALWKRTLTRAEREFVWNLGHGGLGNYLKKIR